MFINPPRERLRRLELGRDLARSVKRGHPWIYHEALVREQRSGGVAHALLYDRKGEALARGYHDPEGALAFRVCSLEPERELDDAWARAGLERALAARSRYFGSDTSGYRLVNGEGDGLPGLVVDRYGDTAVLKLDGPAAEAFWDAEGLAGWLARTLQLQCVYQRERTRGGPSGQALFGTEPLAPVPFLENGARFTADLVQGQKTGFFLDQRDNRLKIRQLSAGRRVLNLFAYTGGFSINAGLGHAASVTTIDLAPQAIEAARHHWSLNELEPDLHEAVAIDAFLYLEQQQKQRNWDLVILDPPSFAPSQKAKEKAVPAYIKLIAQGAAVTAKSGLLAASSCSSHINQTEFLEICQEAIGRARRRARVLSIGGQGLDHPSPLILEEFRYLKFVLLALDP